MKTNATGLMTIGQTEFTAHEAAMHAEHEIGTRSRVGVVAFTEALRLRKASDAVLNSGQNIPLSNGSLTIAAQTRSRSKPAKRKVRSGRQAHEKESDVFSATANIDPFISKGD